MEQGPSRKCNQSDVADAKSCYGAYGDLQTDLKRELLHRVRVEDSFMEFIGFSSTDGAEHL
jgi:hypothetical protein